MAFKLSKSQQTEFNDLLSAVAAEAAAINEEIATFNTGMEALFQKVETAQTGYNEKLQALREFIETTESDFRSEFDDKSDKWKDSERGQRVLEFINRWEQEASDLTDLNISSPEELEADPLDTESFDLPTEVEE